MKKMLLVLVLNTFLFLVACSNSKTNTSSIIGTWEFNYAEVLDDSDDEVLFYNWNNISNCFNGTKFTFYENGNLDFENLIYDVATEQCISSHNLLYGFTWESLGNSNYKINYTYIDELDNQMNTSNDFEFEISNSLLKMIKEDGSIISYWNKL